MTITAIQAIQRLIENPSSYSTTDKLLDLVKQLSLEATVGHTLGSVTVLYSGSIVADGPSANSVIESMVANNANVRVINTTEAAAFLESSQFKTAVANALNVDVASLNTRGTSGNDFLYAGKGGAWAETSKRFVEATVGEVRIMTTAPRLASVLHETEIPALLDKLKVENSAITKIDGISRTELLKVGAAYSTNWTDVMRNSLLNSAITQTHLTQPVSGNYAKFINLIPEEFTSLYKSATADAVEKLRTFTSSFEVPRAATRAFSKLGAIGAIVGIGMVGTQASAAELSGDREGAKTIVKEWAIDTAGSAAGQSVGAAVGAVAATLLAAAGVAVSAPFVGALVLGAALVGGFFGGDAALGFYKLLDDRDDDGKRDILNKLENLLFGATSTITTPLPADLNGDKFTINASLSRDAMVANAKTSIAWRYALRELNSFVITDVSYAAHNTDGSLDLYNSTTGQGALTEAYLADRAAMLAWKLQFDKYNARDDDDPVIRGGRGHKPYSEEWNTNSIQGNWDFIDLATKLPGRAPLTLSIDGVGVSTSDHQVVFGSKNAIGFVAACAYQTSAKGRFGCNCRRRYAGAERLRIHAKNLSSKTPPARSMRLAGPKGPGRRMDSAKGISGSMFYG